MTGLRVGVVVVNYASSLYLEGLLASLTDEPVVRILVWDNYSSQVECSALNSLQAAYPKVTLQCCPVNLGFGAGVNAAIELLASKGQHYDYFWILNPDVTVRPGALAALVSSAIEHGCEIISPLILIAGTQRVWFAGGTIKARAGRSIHRGIGKEQEESLRDYSEVSFVTGAAPLIRADAWLRLGGFAERYFLYCEDADLSMRAADLGLAQGVEPRAVVEHAEGGSSKGSGTKSPTFYYYTQRNRLLLYGQRYSKIRVLLGSGLLETLRLTLLTMRPPSGGAWRRLQASLVGIMAGMAGEDGEWKNRRRNEGSRG